MERVFLQAYYGPSFQHFYAVFIVMFRCALLIDVFMMYWFKLFVDLEWPLAGPPARPWLEALLAEQDSTMQRLVFTFQCNSAPTSMMVWTLRFILGRSWASEAKRMLHRHAALQKPWLNHSASFSTIRYDLNAGGNFFRWQKHISVTTHMGTDSHPQSVYSDVYHRGGQESG